MIQAYVFWHEPAAGIAADAYEAALRTFHERLRAAQPAGLLYTVAYRTDVTPWPSDGAERPCYEDWYLLADTASLDTIEDAAIDRTAGVSHDAVARMSGRGAGGVYRLQRSVSGSTSGQLSEAAQMDTAVMESPVDPITAAAAPSDLCWWLSRPRGLSTEDAIDTLRAATGSPLIWQRRLVLGPLDEFGVWTPATASVDVPVGWSVRIAHRARITTAAPSEAHAG